MRVRAKVVLLGAMASMLMTATAMAASVSVNSAARASSDGSYIRICDIKSDNNWVYANWNTNNNRLSETRGLNNCSQLTVTVSSFRACRHDNTGPDNCSSWVTP
jgi:hypothetical protein